MSDTPFTYEQRIRDLAERVCPGITEKSDWQDAFVRRMAEDEVSYREFKYQFRAQCRFPHLAESTEDLREFTDSIERIANQASEHLTDEAAPPPDDGKDAESSDQD